MKRVLLFDLDGTLIDSLPGIAGALNRSLIASRLPGHELAAVRSFIGDGARMLVERAAAEAPLEILDALEAAFKTDYDTSWPEGTLVYEGITAMLEHFQAAGHPLAVVSNKPHAFTTATVARLFPAIRFAEVCGQRPGIPHKPDPSGALGIAATLGRAPAECVFVGDSTIDAETARRAGMTFVAVTWGYHDREPLRKSSPAAVIDTPGELIAWLDSDKG